jgi:predicted O-methyltransferase YrrM
MGTVRWDATIGTLRAIQQSVQDGNRTLETGCGASTVIFAAERAHHTIISPVADEHKRVRAYLEEIGIDSSRLVFIAGSSDLILPHLSRERILDTAFIDGEHAFPYPAVDCHYITRALKIGGKLIIDDIPIPSTAYVFHYMQSDPSWRLDAILDAQAAAFTLIHEPPAGDYTLQPFNNRFDYGFAPLNVRIRLILSRESSRIRRRVGLRYPGLRRAWRGGARASNQ